MRSIGLVFQSCVLVPHPCRKSKRILEDVTFTALAVSSAQAIVSTSALSNSTSLISSTREHKHEHKLKLSAYLKHRKQNVSSTV